MKKYFIIGLSSLIIEICSTFYIRSVAEGNLPMMLFFAGISPFLGLPFIGIWLKVKHGEKELNKQYHQVSVMVLVF